MKYQNLPVRKNSYSVRELAEYFFISLNAVHARAKHRNMPTRKRKRKTGGTERYFMYHEIDLLKSYADDRKIKQIPEVIYVTRTTEIIESSLRFLDFAECEKSISESKLNYKPENQV